MIDSGVGIEPEALKRIFEAFEQGDPSTTRRFGGLGVGLTISKMLVNLHGGTLTAASEGTNKGATFTIHLPRPMTMPAASPAPVPTEPATKKTFHPHRGRQRSNHKAIERLLRMRGFEITTAASAGEAIEATGSGRSICSSAISACPDMSGWELMRELREIRPLRGIALSGFTESEDQARSLAAGFRLHLGKPLDLQKLLTAIQTATIDVHRPDESHAPAAMLAR